MSLMSTRGGSWVTASQAILNGIAPDGGLYVPLMFPPMSAESIHSMVDMTYAQRAALVLTQFLDDYSPRELEAATATSYGPERFGGSFPAPLRRVDDSTSMLELFHGPTFAFKDMALQLLPHLLTAAARKNGEKRQVMMVAATSGDTGKAALEGFRDVPGTACTVFYPADGISKIQRLQMVTTTGQNTRVIAVRGNFDDCQTEVKKIFSDQEAIQALNRRGQMFSSANSMNFGRLVPQVAYYFSAYADLLKRGIIQADEPVNFVVPTGNFGNILAAYYARNMGLPIQRLICASNRNNVLTDFFTQGTYSTHRLLMKSMSPSMDILVSSNLERLLFEAADRDGAIITVWMRQLQESGSFSVGAQRRDWLNGVFYAGYANDQMTAAEIRRRFQEDQVLMDPHTAVGSHVLNQYRLETGDKTHTVLVSTASPFKFPEDVYFSLTEKRVNDGFEALTALAHVTGETPDAAFYRLRDLPIVHDEVCDPAEMRDFIMKG